MLLQLNSIDTVKQLVQDVAKIDADFVQIDLVSGRYVVDARSILGIFSLDLSKPVEVKVHATDEAHEKATIDILKKYQNA